MMQIILLLINFISINSPLSFI